ncbi:methyltransferase [Amycolatopsis sp. 195334CR]|uniref:methyltransferase n=1 Tax=Amycolatopsis sp. 195334CR TaxID=2814588 RepID=UPI001A8DAB8D|nr:methyltransferase [Amycolatopsis sp. 195334CR]MBN6041917.1 methyltransferase [Amycolatopsis sp. 195334CR]
MRTLRRTDARLLSGALAETRFRPGARVLDLGTGAAAAARGRVAEVVTIERCRRAVLSARVHGSLRRLPVRAFRGDPAGRGSPGRFDVVLANPPYVPGPDGRRYLDPLCARARDLLARQGTLLMVHSSLCDPEATLEELRRQRLRASVVASRLQPFDPVLSGHRRYLERTGLLEPGQDFEELLVIRADRSGCAA